MDSVTYCGSSSCPAPPSYRPSSPPGRRRRPPPRRPPHASSPRGARTRSRCGSSWWAPACRARPPASPPGTAASVDVRTSPPAPLGAAGTTAATGRAVAAASTCSVGELRASEKGSGPDLDGDDAGAAQRVEVLPWTDQRRRHRDEEHRDGGG